MAKTINFNYNGEDYCLEFTRRTVREMEGEGFRLRDVKDKPVTSIPVLFSGAFKCHHKRIKEEVINGIYASITDKEELMGKLLEMYTYAMNSLFDEPDDDEKNVEWTANF